MGKNHMLKGLLAATGSMMQAAADTVAEREREKHRFVLETVRSKVRNEGRGVGKDDFLFANIMNKPEGSRSERENKFVDNYLNGQVNKPITRNVGGRLYQYNSQLGSWADTGIAPEPKAPAPTRRPLTRMIGGKLYEYDPDVKSWRDTGLGGTSPKQPSFTDQFRNDINAGVNRIREGEAPDSVIKELRQQYPSNFSSTHEWNLKTIGKQAQIELGGFRNQAIQELRKMGYPTTENNIRSAIKQLRQPKEDVSIDNNATGVENINSFIQPYQE